MNLLQETKDLCRLYHITPAHSKGQNFLINENTYQAVMEAANLKKTDTVLEVGPGLGFLTLLLAEKVKRVVAVELDKKLAETLELRLKMQEIKNVQVINANILDFKFYQNADAAASVQGIPASAGMTFYKTGMIGYKTGMTFYKAGMTGYKTGMTFYKTGMTERTGWADRYKIVANLPYNITSVFLRKFLSAPQPPLSMTLMLQKEVAERLAAQPGDLSLLGLSVQFYATVRLVSKVPKNDFWPAPKVDSAIVYLQIKKQPPLPATDNKAFFRLLKIGFSAKRKMLKKNLAGGLKLQPAAVEKCFQAANVPLNGRAQDLGLGDWLKLFSLVKDL